MSKTSKPTLSAHLDPTFTQSPTNPLLVTYSYSASAIERVGSASRPASLPPGVLDFYSDGLLKCSTNVAGQDTGGTCPVQYASFGAQTVIVSYISGQASATETSTEQIEPFSTTTTIKLDGAPTCTHTSTPETESCSYTAEVATLDQHGAIPPEGSESITIDTEPAEEFTPAVQPVNAGIPGPMFEGPMTFTLRREHNEEGWRCSISDPIKLEYFFILGTFGPRECGTSMTASARFGDFGGRWTDSASESVAVQF